MHKKVSKNSNVQLSRTTVSKGIKTRHRDSGRTAPLKVWAKDNVGERTFRLWLEHK